MVKNSAFVFIKPHAVTDKVKEVVKATFAEKKIEVKAEGSLSGKVIDEKQLIDKHYYSIASKATLLKPEELNVPKDKFKEKFGLEWEDALKEGKVFNAKAGCEKMGIDALKMDELWAAAKKAGDLIKFGGGFYCGKLGDIYVFNGFFMAMRSKFVGADDSIAYFVVEWDSEACSWADFRGKVLGPTDPADAPKDSLRGLIASKWEEFGLKSAPNVGDNGVHASASPFEALAERTNWLEAKIEEDDFGKALLAAGIPQKCIEAWSLDPQVTIGDKKQSLFDSVEDMDSDACTAKLKTVGEN